MKTLDENVGGNEVTEEKVNETKNIFRDLVEISIKYNQGLSEVLKKYASFLPEKNNENFRNTPFEYYSSEALEETNNFYLANNSSEKN